MIADFFERNKEYGPVILRIGFAAIFLWFGIDKFVHAQNWIGWVPQWMQSLIPLSLTVFMYAQGVIETLIGIMFFIGYRVRFASFIAVLVIFGALISLFGTGQTEIVLRDFGLFAASISLLFMGSNRLAIDSSA